MERAQRRGCGAGRREGWLGGEKGGRMHSAQQQWQQQHLGERVHCTLSEACRL